MVRKHEKLLQQVVMRYHEQSVIEINKFNDNRILNYKPNFEKNHKKGPLITGTDSPQYKVLILEKFKIKIYSDSDSYVGIKINEALNIIKIVNICFSVNLKNK